MRNVTRVFLAWVYVFAGLCVRSSPSITDYDKHGPSPQCFVGNSSIACPNGSKLCSGLNTEANYVYKVTLPGRCKGHLKFHAYQCIILKGISAIETR